MSDQKSLPGVSGAAKLAGVIGWPVTHSRSPRLHGYWLQAHGIDGAYLPLAVPPAELERALRALPALGFRGVNVTVPHKEEALRLVDEATPLARRIGAVNTIIVRADGSLLGDNTDGYGFMENLRERAPDWNPAAAPVVVLGAGGAARAVIAALLEAGVPDIRLYNRSPERARELASVFERVTALPWEAREERLADVGLLVNTTTVGMKDGASPLALDKLNGQALVTDLVYVPLETPLLAAARARGNPVVDGLGMLIHQARPGFAAWFGVEVRPSEALRAMLLADLAA
ncbi:shikimate dehydrogenase [Govanella unica]|uniref:Shikimate dehydrogenase (NADP(+)) n=1 Tax=Govanella unica TaxID=2975056 RepID=A0A9X3Z5P9_9PROT|nr:shikimate dehydrogenase [Govania unica]MDA5192376.1 shikimate dehydrogenase [Govania unica]